ncbi:MAG TPA: 6-aminohexanoate hydrolase, partial [Parvularcula sp.]|nr:6-aminohexanoate hydrolase [Parvularcula sp.]
MNRGGMIAAASAVAAAGAFAFVKADDYAGVGAGYMAKVACSEIFLAGRESPAVLDGEFNHISPALEHVRLTIDSEKKTVTGSIFGLGGANAIYRDGYGCTLRRGALATLPPL